MNDKNIDITSIDHLKKEIKRANEILVNVQLGNQSCYGSSLKISKSAARQLADTYEFSGYTDTCHCFVNIAIQSDGEIYRQLFLGR